MKKLIEKYRNCPSHVKASLWFLMCSFLQKGISVITTPIFTRLLNTAEYGQLSVFNSWSSILMVFVTLHLTSGMYPQGLVKFEKDRARFASSLQGLTFTLVMVWTIIYLLLNDFFNQLLNLTTLQVLVMLVTMWISSVFGFWAEEQRVELNYVGLVKVTLLVSVLNPIVGIIFVKKASEKATAKILSALIVELVCYGSFFFIQLYKGKTFFSKKYWLYALKMNIPLIPHYLSQSVLSGSDRIMIKELTGESNAGIYGLAYSLSLVMTIFNNALMSTLSPWIYRKIRDRKETEIAKVAYASLILVAVLNILLIGFAPEIIQIFAPKEYYDAIYVIPPIAMSVYFMFAYDLFSKFEFYYEKTGYIAAATMGSALLNVITNYIFIQLIGYKAAGYTTLFCYILYALFHYFMMTRICRNNMDGSRVYDSKTLMTITTLFMLAGFTILFLYGYPVIRYAVLSLAFVLVVLFRKRIYRYVEGVMKRS